MENQQQIDLGLKQVTVDRIKKRKKQQIRGRMAMKINAGDSLNQIKKIKPDTTGPSGKTTKGESVKLGQEIKVAKGDVVSGTITDITKSKISIMLSDGSVVDTKSLEQLQYLIGQKVKFLVKEITDQTILLKPLSDQAQVDKLADILKQANISVTDKNLELVEKLIKNNMPINTEELTKLVMFSKRFETASVDQLIFLTKNNLLVSKESLQFVGDFLNNEYSMSKQISGLTKGLSELMNLPESSHIFEAIFREDPAAGKIFDQIKNFFVQGDKAELIGINLELDKIVGNQAADEIRQLLRQTENGAQRPTELLERILSQAAEKNVEPKAEKPIPVELKNHQDFLVQLEKNLGNNLMSETSGQEQVKLKSALSNPLTDKMLTELFDRLDKMNLPEDIKEAITKGLAKRIAHSMLDQELLIPKEELNDIEKVNQRLSKLHAKMEDITNLNNLTGDKMAEVLKQAGQIKTSMELIHQLQQGYSFVHLPVKLNNQQQDSEIYIMNRKKSKKDGLITALLRLDFRNLKHLDIYITKQNNTVEITFYTETDDISATLDRHKKELMNELLKQSLTIMGIHVTRQERGFQVVDDFLEANHSEQAKRYRFDVRA